MKTHETKSENNAELRWNCTFKFHSIHSIKSEPERQQLRLYSIHICTLMQSLIERESGWEWKSSHETVALILHFLLMSLYAQCASGNGTLSIFVSGLFVIFLLHSPAIKFSLSCFRIFIMIHTKGNEACLRFWFAVRVIKEMSRWMNFYVKKSKIVPYLARILRIKQRRHQNSWLPLATRRP